MKAEKSFFILLCLIGFSLMAQENYDMECCQEEENFSHPEVYDHKKLGYKNSYIKETEEQFIGPNWAGKREDSFFDALAR